MDIQDDWEPRVKAMWAKNKAYVEAEILNELGHADGAAKLDNYAAMGAAPWSIVFHHNPLIAQVRSAFAHGDFYPALLGACALGEHILMQLLLALREDYRDHPATTPQVWKSRPMRNWPEGVQVLQDWGVLSSEQATRYEDLRRQRNAAAHFDVDVGPEQRAPALAALKDIQQIIEGVFSPHSGSHFIPETRGAFFLRLEAEAIPFVRRILIPHSVLVSPRHEMNIGLDGSWATTDDSRYEPASLTDEEFAEAYTQFTS
jgi:hypothetical protein